MCCIDEVCDVPEGMCRVPYTCNPFVSYVYFGGATAFRMGPLPWFRDVIPVLADLIPANYVIQNGYQESIKKLSN